MMPTVDPPPPGIMPRGLVPGIEPNMGDHMPKMSRPPIMRGPVSPTTVPTQPGITKLDRVGGFLNGFVLVI